MTMIVVYTDGALGQGGGGGCGGVDTHRRIVFLERQRLVCTRIQFENV